MSISAFEQLCIEFCEIAKVSAPTLQAEGDGLVAFNVDWRGVTIDVVYEPAGGGNCAFVIFQLGPMDSAAHAPERIMLALLQANFMSLQPNPPTFSCHPVTGDAVLQCVFPLLDTSAQKLSNFLDEGVKLALEWRETFFLSDPGAPALPVMAGAALGSPSHGFA